MNKNLEEIFEKIMSAVDVINEYGGYVDAYVREQDRSKKSGLNNFLEIAKMAQKKMITEENKNQYMRILDKAIKKITEGDIIVELKSVKELNPAHRAQLFNYLRLTKKPVGILVNFGASSLQGERYAFIEEENHCVLLDKNMNLLFDSDIDWEYDIEDK